MFFNKLFHKIFREDSASSREPTITTLNLQVNDYCNSHCKMCNIWRQPYSAPFNLEDFKAALNDRLFENVTYVMLTGGEPTLVDNIFEYYKAIVDNVKQLKSMSLTSNCLLPGRVLENAIRINSLCQERGIGFYIALSLDGIGKVHDINRGTPGNFDKLLQVIAGLRLQGIGFFVSTTITSHNVWDLENILDFAKGRNLPIVFRVAGFVDRLYNNDISCIRNFSQDEIYQIRLFFNKLILSYSKNSTMCDVYDNIQRMVGGEKRSISCPHTSCSIVTLGSKGDLRHCSPKGTIFGYLPAENGLNAYNRNEQLLCDIQHKYCPDCIHDTAGTPLPHVVKEREETQKWRSYFTVKSYNLATHAGPSGVNVSPVANRIFIIGWYGTETVGDKAILKGVIDHYRNQGNFTFAISSLYPFITERTLKELHIEADIVPVYSEKFFEYSASSSIICVGGGPLMELEELSLILWAFKIAKQHGKNTHIFGCGIGPLYTDEKTAAVKEILEQADIIELRDEKSKRMALEILPDRNISVIADPSVKVLSALKIAPHKKYNILACFFRELTLEYRSNMDRNAFLEFKTQFEKALADNVRQLCLQYGLTPHLYSMHNFVVGNDDRDFNYKFAESLRDLDPYVENKLSAIENIVLAMQNSTANICMRFHSVVFAHTLEVPFVSIDYTSGGKVHSFMNEHAMNNALLDMNEILASKDALATIYAKILPSTPCV